MKREERGLASKLGGQRESKPEGRPKRELGYKVGLLRNNNHHRPWQRNQYPRRGAHHRKIEDYKQDLCLWRTCKGTCLKFNLGHNPHVSLE